MPKYFRTKSEHLDLSPQFYMTMWNAQVRPGVDSVLEHRDYAETFLGLSDVLPAVKRQG